MALNLKPGDLLEALALNQEGLGKRLSKPLASDEWFGTKHSSNSPSFDRLSKRFGVFWLHLERLYQVTRPPQLSLNHPMAFRVLKGYAELGVTKITPFAPTKVSSLLYVGQNTCFECSDGTDALYMKPITPDLMLLKLVYEPENNKKMIEIPPERKLTPEEIEELRKGFASVLR